MTQTIMKCDYCNNFIDPKQVGRYVLCKLVKCDDGRQALHPVGDVCDECVKKLGVKQNEPVG